MTDENDTPADAISALQIAESRLEKAEETLSDGLDSRLPETVIDGYRASRKDIWEYRNFLLDLRLFLEECERVGVLDEHDIDSVADDWMHAPERARRKYLDDSAEEHPVPEPDLDLIDGGENIE